MNYIKIEKTSISNGSGVRVVLWISGCSICCKECQNPDTWDRNAGVVFDANAKKELFSALEKSYIKGITFSGGHPLEEYNLMDLYDLITEISINYPYKDIWLYTGLEVKIEDLLIEIPKGAPTITSILRLCDVVVDGPFVVEERDLTLKFKGSRNQRLIDVKKSILEEKIVILER